jgi:hypothetical protein
MHTNILYPSAKLSSLFIVPEYKFVNSSTSMSYRYFFLRKLCVFCVRFEVFTAVTMKNDVLLDVTPCGSCKNRRFGET